jgi:hypothetical protein
MNDMSLHDIQPLMDKAILQKIFLKIQIKNYF